jgi:hypothetical protein
LGIQQHDVWLKCFGAANRYQRMIHIGDDAQVRLEQQTGNQGAPDKRGVCENQYGDHLNTLLIREPTGEMGQKAKRTWVLVRQRSD